MTLMNDDDHSDDIDEHDGMGWVHLAAAALYVLVILAVVKKCL